jgi:hypothetical protein
MLKNLSTERQLWLGGAWGAVSACKSHTSLRWAAHTPGCNSHHLGRERRILPRKLPPLACSTGGFHTSFFCCSDTFHMLYKWEAQIIFPALIGNTCPLCVGLQCQRHLTPLAHVRELRKGRDLEVRHDTTTLAQGSKDAYLFTAGSALN